MTSSNAIGDRGESIFTTRITQENLFRVYFLGEKAPIVDFLLEILDEKNPYYFMVQVKSTEKGYNKKGRLKASVPIKKLNKLIDKALPTYIAGVDLNSEIVYVCPAFDKNIKYTTIATNHLLYFNNKEETMKTLSLLKQDVIHYYKSYNIAEFKETYKSLL